GEPVGKGGEPGGHGGSGERADCDPVVPGACRQGFARASAHRLLKKQAATIRRFPRANHSPTMQLGPYQLPNALFVAPMAGVTDRPFRKLCKRLGAGYAVSEMVTSRPELWDSLKTSRRANHEGEAAPIAVQIAGTDAAMMADAARYNIDRGAQIIDINMGCPAKKVCNKWAGSALMQDEALAIEIVQAVVAACEPRGVPVTLKMRTGWCASVRNAPTLALAAESAGIQMLTVHGRTREQGYKGQAEHDTVAHIKSRVRIPVV